jgi:hypothetical protein
MNPFEGMIRKTHSIELGGETFYFKALSMGAIAEVQKIEDPTELAEKIIVESICDENGKRLEGFKGEYLKILEPSELMSLVTFAQSVSMPKDTEKKS